MFQSFQTSSSSTPSHRHCLTTLTSTIANRRNVHITRVASHPEQLSFTAFNILRFFGVTQDMLVREHDRPIQCVWKPTVAPTDHRSANDELAEGAKHTAQGGRYVGVP